MDLVYRTRLLKLTQLSATQAISNACAIIHNLIILVCRHALWPDVVGHINRTEMTIETISKYYKWLSVVTLIVSIVGPILSVEGTRGEKIWIGVLINLQFHLAFQSLSRVPFGMYQYVEKGNSQIKGLAKKFLILFSWMVMVLAIIGFVGFLKAALNDHPKLLATMTFSAIFLGGYSSKIKLSEH